jgi:ATP dependent DNA ligase domain
MDTAQLSLVRQPFNDPDFLFELKHDGFRALAHIWDGNCELVSRKRNAYKSFNELRENLAKLKVQKTVIDGELVCLDSEGRSIFDELLFRRGCPIFTFDLLYLNGRVESNNVSNSLVLFGIDLAGSNNVAKGNDVSNSGQAAILIEGNDNNVQGNELTEAPVGILKVSGTVGNTHTSNSFFDLLTTVQDPVLTHSIHVGPKQ